MINIYLLDSANNIVGTVGSIYYERHSIKELIEMYKPYKLRFYK